MTKKALITGVSGQDGSYLSELLLEKGYQVHGIVRRTSSFNTWRIDHLNGHDNFFTHYGDLLDTYSLIKTLEAVKPDEIYNLAAQSHVKVSFDMPEYTANCTSLGLLRLLEATKSIIPHAKFYQASTSELFGGFKNTAPQNEKTPFFPRSPYAVSKLAAHYYVSNYRDAYNLYAVNGILFNHESPRRGENFVTRKISLGVAKYLKDQSSVLTLGNLDSCRDWGHAKDYVRGMWQMLQKDFPSDYILSSNENRTVRDFVNKAFNYASIDVFWDGKGVDEKGYNKKNGDLLVEVSEMYFRPSEVDFLLGDSRKAEKELDWQRDYSFDDLVLDMVKADIELLNK